MHNECIQYVSRVKAMFPKCFKKKNVLDVGSQDINGSAKFLFNKGFYHGVDIGRGKNVHHVINPSNLPESIFRFDTIICLEVFEHDKFYPYTLNWITRLLKPGGLFVFTCAGVGRSEHGTRRTETKSSPYTTDYYENLTISMVKKIPGFVDIWQYYKFEYDPGSCDLRFFGFKKSKNFIFNEVFVDLLFEPTKWIVIKSWCQYFFRKRVRDAGNALTSKSKHKSDYHERYIRRMNDEKEFNKN